MICKQEGNVVEPMIVDSQPASLLAVVDSSIQPMIVDSQPASLLAVVDSSIQSMIVDSQPASLLAVVNSSIQSMIVDSQPASLLAVVDSLIQPKIVDSQPASLVAVVDAGTTSFVAFVVDQDNDNIIDERSLSMSRKIAKKGQGDPKKWKLNIAANKRLHGDKRQMKPINCKCCHSKMSDENRKEVFDNYWQVTWERKRDFVITHTEICNASRKRTQNAVSRRGKTIKYYLPVLGQRIQVCKQFFLGTLCVGEMFVRLAARKANNSGSIFSNPHGHSQRVPPNATSPADRLCITSFIEKFPTIPSHYCRKDSKLLYLEPGLSVAKMYDLYKEECNVAKRKPCSKKVFTCIFKTFRGKFI